MAELKKRLDRRGLGALTRSRISKPPRSNHAIKLVAFDGFGTLVRVTAPLRAYRMLLDSVGIPLNAEIRELSMSKPLGFSEYARQVAPCIDAKSYRRAADALTRELSSVSTFASTLSVLSAVRKSGRKIVVISNLACPYGEPLKHLLRDYVDVWCLSYEVGLLKPDPEIFRHALRLCRVSAKKTLMIGDNEKNDLVGAERVGIHGALVRRSSEGNDLVDVVRLFLPDLFQVNALEV